MSDSNDSALATVPSLPPALAPRPQGDKAGVPYELAIRPDIARAWPVYEAALRLAGVTRAVPQVLQALWEVAASLRPAAMALVDRRRLADELQLERALAVEGLTLVLACARYGLSERRIKDRLRDDPGFAERVESYRQRGLAKLHGGLFATASAGKSERAAMFLLKHGDPSYGDTLRMVEPDEGDVLRSKAWGRIMTRLAGCLCAECSRTVGEELGRG